MARLLPLSLLSLLAATATQAAWDCSTPLQLGGDKLDLKPLAGEHHFEVSTPTPPTTTKTQYRLSLCSALATIPSTPSEDQCPADTNLCMTTISTRSGLEDRIISVVPVVQKLEAAPVAEYLEGEKVLTKGWLLKLEGGSYNGVKQSAEVEMKCDEGAKETVPTFNSYDPLKGVLSLKWTTAAACSTSSGSPPPKDDGGNKDEGDKPKEGEDKPVPSSGMGFFGWFFTLLFLTLVIYLVLGSWHNYTQYGATGLDAIPHRDVWRDLPYVVADLFKGRGGSRNGYSALG